MNPARSENPMAKPTLRGYSPYDLMSAMQKFLRRSMEKEAIFCFLEMEASGMYPHIRNRLMTVVYEDVGMSNPGLVNSINGHISAMNEYYKSNNGAWRLVLSYIVLEICRGKKDRTTDHFVCSVCNEMALGYKLNLDDYADFVYDMHTRKGKELGRGMEHFDKVASKIIESNISTDYRDAENESSAKMKQKGLTLEDYKKTAVQETLF